MDYMSLFPSISRSLPRFSALAQAILSQASELQAVIAALPAAYSVQEAAGKQLDALGASFMFPRPEGMDSIPAPQVKKEKLLCAHCPVPGCP